MLRHPVAVLVVCLAIVALGAWQARHFGLDATAESLTLERDEALAYYRLVRARYGSDDYLIVTFAPKAALFSDEGLSALRRLRDGLLALPGVESVVSILDVPLIESPPLELARFAEGVRRLEAPGTDRALARRELLDSPLYRDLLISADGRTTALSVNLVRDAELLELRERRDRLREQAFEQALAADQAETLASVSAAFDERQREAIRVERETLAQVRAVLDTVRAEGTLHLGGVPMIVADSIDFIRHDLIVFGSAVVVFLVVILLVAFHRPRWALLALANCAATCIVMLGLLGFTGWRVTVVSSNFVSLLLILVLALTLHVIVRYRETQLEQPEASQRVLIRESVRRIVVPCFYTALTTMLAFGSLIVSGIRPVIDFGWMMVIGLAVGFVFTFTLFTAALALLSPGRPRSQNDVTARITGFFAGLVDRRIGPTILVSLLLCALGVAGITRLTVENRFIDYYKHSTEIYQGMALIDQALGGTTPLDVVIDAPVATAENRNAESAAGAPGADRDEAGEFDDLDDLDDLDDIEDIYAEPDGSGGITARSYWFNNPRLAEVTRMHDFLDAMPETGKVISIATAARLLAAIDEAVLTDNVLLSVVHKRMPDDVRAALIEPYLSDDGDQIRISIRVFESDPTLRRNALIERIQSGLAEQFELAPEQVQLSGMLVLYNNMLQSLFRSQVLTLGAVFGAIFVMFCVLFRSLRTAATAIVPNLLSAVLVLGLMGWLAIPLDMMTITIAAITVGIAVDDTIHYVHRFSHEIAIDGDAWAAVHRSHRSIGRAMYYTSATIMLGFSILVLSQFNPTIYFGLLTGMAMVFALLADLTLLPVLLVAFRVGAPR